MTTDSLEISSDANGRVQPVLHDVESEEAPLRIDLDAVLASKLGKRAKRVPRFLINRLKKIICVDGLNELLRNNFPKKGGDFCRGVFRDLSVNIEVRGRDNLPSPANRRVVIVSNHPLGGLDGMALIAFFSEYYGGRIHFLVNDLLMAVRPLNEVFVPVNKHGAQSREASKRMEELFMGDDPILIFPAGLVSRLQQKDTVKDLEWKKMFVNRAISSHRDVIPVHFSGNNSAFFYKFARRRKSLGLKFNIEMIYLPREVFRAKGSTFIITCGKPIAWSSLKGGAQASAMAERVKEQVYALAPGER